MAIHIWLNISRSKDKQAMRFDQSIDYNTRNIFLEKSYEKCGVETIIRPFSKNQNWAYLWINSMKFYTVCFIVCKVEGYQNIVKLSWRPLAFTSNKAFCKIRKRSRRPSCLIFYILFEENCFCCHILSIYQISLSPSFFFVRY